MKLFFRRLLLKSRLARNAAHLDALQVEREMLDRTERFCIRQSNDLRLQLQLLNLDIRNRHA